MAAEGKHRPATFPLRPVWLGLTGALLGAAPVPPQNGASVSIAAHLLASDTGRLSGDLVTRPDALRGASAAAGALVVVRVAPAAGTSLPGVARVQLVAVADRRSSFLGGDRGARHVVLQRLVRLGSPGADGAVHAGFWLDGIGCQPIELKATLTGAGRPASARTRLDFECAE